jgi:hypothetical protein
MTQRDDDTGTADDSGAGEAPGTAGSDSSHRRPDPELLPDDAAPEVDLPSSDPRQIRSLAVTESDVVDALEAAARGGREIVLRITPPFSGRMRARLHDAGVVDTADESGETHERAAGSDDGGEHVPDAAPVCVPPERFVADCPAYPTVDDTEDELRASETTYSRERHRERHRAAVAEWRQTVRERLVEAVIIHTDAGPTRVSVAYLG